MDHDLEAPPVQSSRQPRFMIVGGHRPSTVVLLAHPLLPGDGLEYEVDEPAQASPLKTYMLMVIMGLVVRNALLTMWYFFEPKEIVRTKRDLAIFVLVYSYVQWRCIKTRWLFPDLPGYDDPLPDNHRPPTREYVRQQVALLQAMTGESNENRINPELDRNLAEQILRRGGEDFQGSDFEGLRDGLESVKVERTREQLDIVATVVRGGGEGEGDCAICLERMTGKEKRMLSGCGHVFCKVCLERWVVEEGKGRCPVCSFEI